MLDCYGLSSPVFIETGHADFDKPTSIPEELHNFEGILISSGGTPGILGEFSAVRKTLLLEVLLILGPDRSEHLELVVSLIPTNT